MMIYELDTYIRFPEKGHCDIMYRLEKIDMVYYIVNRTFSDILENLQIINKIEFVKKFNCNYQYGWYIYSSNLENLTNLLDYLYLMYDKFVK